MIDLRALKHLPSQKRKDAEVLFRLSRNNGAIYLMGYALEFSFKRKVCQTLGFNNGFPESRTELNLYSPQLALFNSVSPTISLTQLKQIKNHDLDQLLIYSGAQTRIINMYWQEWLSVRCWNPENRYRVQRFTNAKAESFMQASRVILKEIALIRKVNGKNTHIRSKKAKKSTSKVISIQYVLPLGGNGWVVKNNKAAKFTVITDSKREAISIARTIAKNKRIELVVHGRDGNIELRENYAIRLS